MSDSRARFRRACAAVTGVLPRRVRAIVAPSMVGFAVVNGFTFAVDLALLSLLIDGLGLPLSAGITVAYGTAFALSFVLNRWLNFDPERPVGAQVGRYVGVIAVNYAVIVLGVTQGLAAIGVPYQLARLAAGACEAVFMYVAMRWFVFGRLPAERSSPHPGPRTPPPAAGTYPGPVLSRIDLRAAVPAPTELRALLPRAAVDVDAVVERVRPVIDAVRERGAGAALEYSERFDRVRPESVRVPHDALRAALDATDPEVRAALESSIERARAVHADQRRVDTTTQVVPGGTVSERWVPVSRVGLYAPGGLAVYPSSVVMNVVPAQTAGVDGLVVCSPPQADFGGRPHPLILAAAALLGVDEVWAVGGAQAVALLAYGGVDTDGTPLDPVDMVTGPGNVYVTAAKRVLRGRIGIDSEAGTTEIAILADDSADPVHVAADLISQAEHDPAAASVLVTTSPALADAVDAELETQVATTKHTERIATALSGPQSGTILVASVDDGLRVVDAYAAEHLEIQTADPRSVAARVRNAGAVFVGPHSPVSLGDYCAGSNHVLPTGGCARHSSGLSVQTFLRGIHVVDYSADALAEVADRVVALADAEDLPAHGQAVTARFGRRRAAQGAGAGAVETDR